MPDVLKYLPNDEFSTTAPNASAKSRDVLVFFITGNPGLIGYYAPFLSTLSRLLEDSRKRINGMTRVHVYGRGLRGFYDNDHEPFSASRPPFNVKAQVDDTLDYLKGHRIENGDRQGEEFDSIILMGHSVGAFITLEIFDRLLNSPAPRPGLNLQTGILLFPTITHLLDSPSGQRVDRLRNLPGGAFIASHLHSIASTFLYPWPASVLSFFVRNALGMPPHAAAATVQFLRSPDAVWQAIYMGQDELKVISEDKWAEELWQVAEADGALQQQQQDARVSEVPKFFMYFGAHDHWVANEQRAKFIEKREEHAGREGPAAKRGRTRIVVDEDDIPHAFCISTLHRPLHQVIGRLTYEQTIASRWLRRSRCGSGRCTASNLWKASSS
jgi:pimeloyl-ACP methyl ester carboxylesterase